VPLIDYFTATDDATAASTVDDGPGAAGFETLPAKGIDPYDALGALESLLTGRAYDEIRGDPRQCQRLTDTSEDAFVVTVTDTLRDSLAAAGDDRLDGVAREWAGTDGLAGVDAAVLGQALRLFAALAKRAIDTDGHLYCWWAL
jgi:hypothetical protein